MYEFRQLLDRFWITRAGDKELYYLVRRAQNEYRRLVNELLGWNMIVNESIIKLEKVPPRAMAWMGIQEFQETMDYCLLCALLLFLSDLEDGEEFLLSRLTDAVKTFLEEECPVDWTRFPHRKSLVRVLRYAQDTGLLVVYDGSTDAFGNDQNQEVLYENTGLSRHFTVHFEQSILDHASVRDFEARPRDDEAARTGRERLHRIYQQLALAPALYCSEETRGDFDYIRNQHLWIEKNLQDALGGEHHVHKDCAFFVLEESGRFGAVHPSERAVSDVVLLLCARFRDAVNRGEYARGENDTVLLSPQEFRYELNRCSGDSRAGWGKTLRELPPEKLYREIVDYMADWMLLDEREDGLLLYPGVGKWTGRYPAAWQGTEETDEPLENA